MGVGQQYKTNLLVCSRHFELVEERPETQFPATTIHCLVTHFHPRVPIAYNSLQGGSHVSHHHQGLGPKR